MSNCSQKDCLKAPIPSRCFFYCIHQILLKATPDQKRNVLKLQPATATAIFNAINTHHPKDFQELAEYLESVQLEEIIRVFRMITQEQLDQLN